MCCVCELLRSLDSFKIFDSIAGKMCQRFVWRVHGRVLHVQLFKQYIAYVFFSSLSIYIFPFCVERSAWWPLIGVLLCGQIMYDIYYIYSVSEKSVSLVLAVDMSY